MVIIQNKQVTAKIIGFGCACLVEQPAKFKIPTGMSIHIAPEVAGGGAVTKLSDIFSYGRLVEDVEAVIRAIPACTRSPLRASALLAPTTGPFFLTSNLYLLPFRNSH